MYSTSCDEGARAGILDDAVARWVRGQQGGLLFFIMYVLLFRGFFPVYLICAAAGGHTLSRGPASASASAPGRDRDKMDIRAPDLVGYKK